MKITPIEIRQKSFEKKLRGYDRDEVSAFLVSLSNEWERMLDEHKDQKIKLDQAEKEVRKLREIENSLFKTLKAAEDTGANLIRQANKAADLHLQETEMKAEALLSESKSKARGIIERAELQAKEMIEEMQEVLKDLEKNYRRLENQKDNLVAELKTLSADIMARLERTSSRQNPSFKIEDHMKKVRGMVRDSEQRINEQRLESAHTAIARIPSLNSKDENSTHQLQKFIEAKDKKGRNVVAINENKEPPVSAIYDPAKEEKKPAVDKMKMTTNYTKADSPKPEEKPMERTDSEELPSEGSFFDSL